MQTITTHTRKGRHIAHKLQYHYEIKCSKCAVYKLSYNYQLKNNKFKKCCQECKIPKIEPRKPLNLYIGFDSI